MMEDNPIKIIGPYQQHTEKEVLAKSYSKMMKNIGDELKHIGPHSLRQLQQMRLAA